MVISKLIGPAFALGNFLMAGGLEPTKRIFDADANNNPSPQEFAYPLISSAFWGTMPYGMNKLIKRPLPNFLASSAVGTLAEEAILRPTFGNTAFDKLKNSYADDLANEGLDYHSGFARNSNNEEELWQILSNAQQYRDDIQQNKKLQFLQYLYRTKKLPS